MKNEADELPAMKHVPPLDWVLRKVDELRERADKLFWAAFDAGRDVSADQSESIDRAFRLVGKSLDCLVEVARRGPVPRTPPTEDVRLYVEKAFSAAIAAVRSIDAVSFNRRSSETEFQRAPGEPVLGALLVVLMHLRAVEQLVEAVNRDVRELLLAKLVVLEHPVNEETLRPIA